MCDMWKPAVLVFNGSHYAKYHWGGKGEMITVTMWVILMMLVAVINGLALLLGIKEMTQLTKFVNWIMYAGLATRFILTGLYYMATKRWPTSPPPGN